MSKVCVVERLHDHKKTFCSLWGWMEHPEQAMTWPDAEMARKHLSQMVLPAGVIRVVEIDRPDEQKAAPEVQTDYDPFGYGG